MKKLILLALIACFSITALTAQASMTQKEKFKNTYSNSKALVKTQDFEFIASWVHSNKKREQLGANANTIAIQKSDITGVLGLLSSENRTLIFDGKVNNYTTTFDDENQRIAIDFKVNSSGKLYDLHIDIAANGNAFLNIASERSATISYIGQLK